MQRTANTTRAKAAVEPDSCCGSWTYPGTPCYAHRVQSRAAAQRRGALLRPLRQHQLFADGKVPACLRTLAGSVQRTEPYCNILHFTCAQADNAVGSHQRCCHNLSTALGCNKASHHHGQRDQQQEHARVAAWLLHPTRTDARAPARKHNTVATAVEQVALHSYFCSPPACIQN